MLLPSSAHHNVRQCLNSTIWCNNSNIYQSHKLTQLPAVAQSIAQLSSTTKLCWLQYSGKITALCQCIYISFYSVSRAFAVAITVKYQQKLCLFADFYCKYCHRIMQDTESQKQNWRKENVKLITVMATAPQQRRKEAGVKQTELEANGMKEVEGFSVQLVLSHRATAAKASCGKFGFLVLAVAAFLSTFVLLFILHPTVSSAFLPLAVPHPAAPSFLTCSLLCSSQSHRLCKSP